MYEAGGNYTGAGQCGHCLVMDGEWLPFTGSLKPAFSRDGKRLAYGSYRCLTSDCSRSVSWAMVDGQPGPEFAGIMQSNITFSPDGKRVAYELTEKDGSGRTRNFIVVDGRKAFEFGRNTSGTIASIVFSPDGKRLAYDAGVDGKDAVVLDGQVVARFDKGGWSPFSAPTVSISLTGRNAGGSGTSAWLTVTAWRRKAHPATRFPTLLFLQPRREKSCLRRKNRS